MAVKGQWEGLCGYITEKNISSVDSINVSNGYTMCFAKHSTGETEKRTI